ncbi:helix-turn-helix domain-containing protein [Mycolicibacterium holsaticum DSM 44478 = JCM 12374]|nr:helix-turn-helix domain-containing protein [Mycolicibacterium holsaticum]QZA11968.1 helix-turn-helix domain-containing protein [Mycolicibacterium holsaticum DSM 44478 = JCM 12374]UNC10545.1 helix-turn-helix domain-containing protein [Mycolicibacterium holsaticum DSM 44478 = JCM 12374]
MRTALVTPARVGAHVLSRPLTSSKVDSVIDIDALTSTDPAVGLKAVHALQRFQQRMEAIHVANAREQGWSWQAIAGALGVSRQAVHQKHNRRK